MKYKKITSLSEYTDYCNQHENLVAEDYDKHIDEIELIEILIDEYDSREVDFKKEMNPVELLRSILEEEHISKATLAKELGTSRQLISDILRYRRNISKDMVTKLSARFKLRPEAFSRPYLLKNYKRAERASTTDAERRL